MLIIVRVLASGVFLFFVFWPFEGLALKMFAGGFKNMSIFYFAGPVGGGFLLDEGTVRVSVGAHGWQSWRGRFPMHVGIGLGLFF